MDKELLLPTLLQAARLLGNFVKEGHRLLPSDPVALLPQNGPVQVSKKSHVSALGTMLPGDTEPEPGMDKFVPLKHSMHRVLRAHGMGQG